ncbi:MAG: alpha-hydroxy-acid oxidizing protein [Acidobacteria bacterium]|nr:alpha-hydroxy-acid oxidizing protein [Acidobacteriota bacterium]
MTAPRTFGELWQRGLARIREMGREADLVLDAETQASHRLNRAYLDRLAFEMRVLGAVVADTRTTLFGVDLAAPVIGAPLGFGRLLGQLAAHGPQYGTGYLEPIAEGLKAAGSLMGLGVSTSEQVQSVVAVGAPTYVIVKPYRERERILYKMRDAEARGAVAVGIDVDAYFGVRTRYEPVGEPYVAPIAPADLRAIREQTRLPFIVKGVLSVRDALVARDVGASAVVVCHHGGEIIDYAVPPVKLLPDIARALDGSGVTVIAGSGLHTGTDVLKALARGADAVMLGTALMVGLAADGADGVRDLVVALVDELRRNMSITGCASVREIDPSIVHEL